MIQISALRSRLEKQPTDLRQITSYFGDRTLVTSEGESGAVLGAKAKDDEMYGPGTNPKVSIISVLKTDKKPNR